MACDLRCPECGDNFGKDTQQPVMAWCSDCQIYIYNPYGEKDNTPEEAEFIRKHKRPKKYSLGGNLKW